VTDGDERLTEQFLRDHVSIDMAAVLKQGRL
jgi:hypothetical protein